MCKAKAISFAIACGHYSMHSEEPCASALARDPSGCTPCDDLINELELQRVGGSWYFVINFKGQSISVFQTSSGHCDARRRDMQSDTGEASNSDSSVIGNSDESGSRETGVETKTSEGKRKGLWKKIKGTAGKG